MSRLVCIGDFLFGDILEKYFKFAECPLFERSPVEVIDLSPPDPGGYQVFFLPDGQVDSGLNELSQFLEREAIFSRDLSNRLLFTLCQLIKERLFFYFFKFMQIVRDQDRCSRVRGQPGRLVCEVLAKSVTEGRINHMSRGEKILIFPARIQCIFGPSPTEVE